MRIPGSTPFINPLDLPNPDIEINKSADKPALQNDEVSAERTPRSDRSPSGGASMLAEQRFGGLAQEAMLRSQLDYERIIPDRPEGPNKAAGPSDLLVNGSSGPEVKDLQHKLNEWRMQNGKPPIAEDGAFGKGTEDALKEYQTATGLKADGIAGATTKAMLKLEGEPNFRQLSPESKKEVGQYLDKYKDNPAAKENVMNLATDSSFANATPESRGLALLTLSKDPANVDHRDQVKYALADTVKLERSPDFQNLSADTKSLARLAMLERGTMAEEREYIAELVSNPNFKNLTPAQQEKMMDAIAVNTERGVPAGMLNILNSKGFSVSDKDTQANIVDMASKYANDPQKLSNLSFLLDDPAFVNATPESRGLALLMLSTDPADADHLAQLKSALADTTKLERNPDFQKLSSDTKSLARLAMLERGKNPEDREYIAELVSNPNFKNLTPAQQEKMMDAIAINTERFGPAQMLNILNSKGFSVSDRDMQARIIDMASKDANDPQKLSNLSLMLDDPEFVNASKEDRYGQLNRLTGRTGLEI